MSMMYTNIDMNEFAIDSDRTVMKKLRTLMAAVVFDRGCYNGRPTSFGHAWLVVVLVLPLPLHKRSSNNLVSVECVALALAPWCS